jgi:hypothetical protein
MEEANIRQEINKYKKFKKVDGATYRKVNQFLRKRTYITAREWALARLCTDFRTSGGAEMTFIGQNLPELVPFMEDTYTPQAVNQARSSFKKKVRKASATFFYGAMCGFFTTDELDDLLFEASEVARFLLEVEGTTLDIDEEIDIEDRITGVMRSVGEAAKTILRTRGEDSEIPKPPDTLDGQNTGKKARRKRTIQKKEVETHENSHEQNQKPEEVSHSKSKEFKEPFSIIQESDFYPDQNALHSAAVKQNAPVVVDQEHENPVRPAGPGTHPVIRPTGENIL